jgi:single-strand DNA-binding protein
MAISLNKVQLIGNLGKDPDIRATADGKEIATLNLATSESWKNKTTGERKDKTEWHRIVIFVDGLVKFVKDYTKKGSKLYVEGSLQTRKWQDKDGKDRDSTEIVLNGYGCQIVLLGEGGNNSSSTDQPTTYANKTSLKDNYVAPASKLAEELDDEIPF